MMFFSLGFRKLMLAAYSLFRSFNMFYFVYLIMFIFNFQLMEYHTNFSAHS